MRHFHKNRPASAFDGERGQLFDLGEDGHIRTHLETKPQSDPYVLLGEPRTQLHKRVARPIENRGIGIIKMGRANDLTDSPSIGCTCHLKAVVQARRTIINAWKYMRMRVDHVL